MGSRGVLISPNYPSSYEPNTRCVWTIRGPVGHYMNFQFTNLDLPNPSTIGGNCSTVDYVEIRERNATSKSPINFTAIIVNLDLNFYS